MKRNQIIAISACAVLLLVMYLFGNTKKPKPADDTATEQQQEGHAQPAAGGESLNIMEYINGVNAQITDKAIGQKINELTDQKDYKGLMAQYTKLDKPLAVAYYSVQEAKHQNRAPIYISAGDYNAMLMQSAPDDKARKFLGNNVLECYKSAVELDTGNTDYKIRLAGAYLEDGGQPMQGVMMLLDIVKKDSNNVDAQLMLGRFGLISGQFDKAIARFEKILYLQPQNSEAMFLLAQAYVSKGEKQKAIELLEKCSKLVKEADAKKEIEKEIESLKKPNG
ncbi:MAG TPA: tetratricopeptide repeat protein [Chitinophagales bacterium]|nr:tetratricopeptide repeat protein [Chitinophagales bacterium]